jgi:hypothetical protein
VSDFQYLYLLDEDAASGDCDCEEWIDAGVDGVISSPKSYPPRVMASTKGKQT